MKNHALKSGEKNRLPRAKGKVISFPNLDEGRRKRLEAKQRAEQRFAEKFVEISAAIDAGRDPLLKLKEVIVMVNESRATVYRKLAANMFPKPIKKGKAAFWLASEIEKYKLAGRTTDKV